MSGLLVSVRSAAEAAIALAGGAALIDVKEPDHGSLGRATSEVIAEVLDLVAARRPVSAALGELAESENAFPDLPRLTFVKWGLAGMQSEPDWPDRLRQVHQRLQTTGPCRLVVAAYGDWRRAKAPLPLDVVYFAVRERAGGLLLDTWHKDGSTLLDWVSMAEMREWRELCRSSGVCLALAGSLGAAAIRALLPVQPDWFAVRGAVCAQGQRRGAIDEGRIRELVELLGEEKAPPSPAPPRTGEGR
jgi:uncharacterized protein (UPF0264 family)